MNAPTDTIWVRRPTAEPAGALSAPTFRLERSLAGLTIGLRTDRAWRSWQLISSIWAEYLQRDGAQTIAVETGAQIGEITPLGQVVPDGKGGIKLNVVYPPDVANAQPKLGEP